MNLTKTKTSLVIHILIGATANIFCLKNLIASRYKDVVMGFHSFALYVWNGNIVKATLSSIKNFFVLKVRCEVSHFKLFDVVDAIPPLVILHFRRDGNGIKN